MLDALVAESMVTRLGRSFKLLGFLLEANRALELLGNMRNVVHLLLGHEDKNGEICILKKDRLQ